VSEVKDIIVVGGGPAGLSAALYGARAGMKVAVVEKSQPGGQLWMSEKIENYPGFPGGAPSAELASRFEEQVKMFDAEIVSGEALKLEADENKDFILSLSSGEKLNGASVILCCGAAMRPLNVPGEKEYLGRGVSYCAVCDGPLYRDKIVAVVGGGNTACEEALFLARFAKKIYLIHRRPELRAVKSVSSLVKENEKIELLLEKEVLGLEGNELIEKVNLKDGSEVQVDGVFIFIGLEPKTKWVADYVKTEKGFVVTDTSLRTSVDGVFAAGDCRFGSLRQVVSACGEGAAAGEEARKYVEKKKGIHYDW